MWSTNQWISESGGKHDDILVKLTNITKDIKPSTFS